MSSVSLEVHLTDDPVEFLALTAPYLARDPLLSNVVSSVTQRAAAADERGEPAPGHPRWWAVVRTGSEVVGVAMRTAPFAPHPMYVLPMPDAAARALAHALHRRGEVVRGVNGAIGAGAALAGELVRLGGGAVHVEEHTRLFELGELVEPGPVEGRLRRAGPGDTERCLGWFEAFGVDAAEQAGRAGGDAEGQVARADVVERIGAGRVWLWEDAAGDPVHLTGFSPPSLGVARIGPVYTPREHRGRGYASAAVAAVSRRLLAEDARVCLFTDQANPTSNRIYRALGFRPVLDMADLRLEPGPAPGLGL